MNICFICKYPPIQGGVSMHGYWAARGLAKRGHRVFVITNADEVEATFRLHLSLEDRAVGGEYARVFTDTSGAVTVYSTQPPDRTQMYYIPMNNPTVTRLSAIATDVIRSEKCQVIFSYYFEPYGLAAHLASRWTGIPYILKHAGSDLNRLLPLKDLRSAYLEVLGWANRIISRGVSRKLLLSYGIPDDKINSDVAFGVPTEYFHPNAPLMDLNGFLGEITNLNPRAPYSSLLEEPLPVLGIYGKLGEFKGSFDLLCAMARLIQEGFPFYLVLMSHGWQEYRFHELVEKLELSKYVRFLPFVPHWRIPSFIRCCTAVAFLERDFPIAAHTPTIPSEIVACGKCLVLSEEVARKQPFRTQIRNRKNIVIVPDPKQHDSLASCLRFALENPGRAEEIGHQGFQDFGPGHPHEKYIDCLERLLEEVAQEAPQSFRQAANSETRERKDVLEITARLFPFTSALLDEEQREQLMEAVAGTALGEGIGDRSELGVQLGQKLLSLLTSDFEEPSLILEVCRYECKGHEWMRIDQTNSAKTGAALSFSIKELGHLYPELQPEIEVVDFSYDVEAICLAIEGDQEIPRERANIKVLFNSGFTPMRINEPTNDLLGLLAEGSTPIANIFQTLAHQYNCKKKSARIQLRDSGMSVLESLYWEGLIHFGTLPTKAVCVTARSDNGKNHGHEKFKSKSARQ